MTRIFAVVAALFMAACATDPAALNAVIEAQAKARPTLAVTCPVGGCTVEYMDPRDRSMKLPTNGWDAVIAVSGSAERIVSGAILPATAIAVAKEIRRAGEGGNVTTTTTTNSTASGAGASTAGDAHYEQIGPDSNNTTSGDTITTTESHDSAVTDSHDSTVTDSHDSTAAPVVVQVPAQP